MKRSKEELGRIHKEKCKELKQVRARMAEDLGIDLHQTECTYEGYCSGTCPKCKSEELRLNVAILKKQMEEADMKRRVAAAGLTTVAALCLTGCNVIDRYTMDGGIQPPVTEEVLEGDVVNVVDYEGGLEVETSGESTEGTECELTEEVLEGDVAIVVDYEGGMEVAPPSDSMAETDWELAGEVPVMPESVQGEE